ncbi:MAG: hypothetical protein QXT80_03010 [Thermoplasmatales archaeon]
MEIMFKTQFNSVPDSGEINDEVSLTVPDMSYTVRELLEKFTSGVMPAVERNPLYEDDPDFDNIDPSRLGDFDLVDLLEMQEEYQTRIENVNAAIAAKDAEKLNEVTTKTENGTEPAE